MHNPPPGAGSEWASSFAPGSFGSLEGRGALPRGTARGSSAQGPPAADSPVHLGRLCTPITWSPPPALGCAVVHSPAPPPTGVYCVPSSAQTTANH